MVCLCFACHEPCPLRSDSLCVFGAGKFFYYVLTIFLTLNLMTCALFAFTSWHFRKCQSAVAILHMLILLMLLLPQKAQTFAVWGGL